MLRVLFVQFTTLIWCQIPVNNPGTITYSHREHSLEVCVVSDQNHLQNCGQARRQSNKDEVAMTEKAAFPAAGTLLTQFPSAHLLF